MRRANVDDIGGPNWPAFCYLPLEYAGLVVAELMRSKRMLPTPILVTREASLVAGLSAWRMTQGVYRFDPTLYAKLIETPVDGNVPAAIFQHLPEWCVYLETPELLVPSTHGEIPLRGCFAWVDRVRETHQDILTLLLDGDGAALAVSHVPLVGTMDEALTNVSAKWRDAFIRGNAPTWPPNSFATTARRTLTPIVSLILYLCAEPADIAGQRGTPQPMQLIRRCRSGERLFEVEAPTVWGVGMRTSRPGDLM
jgi:hypothetical protein